MQREVATFTEMHVAGLRFNGSQHDVVVETLRLEQVGVVGADLPRGHDSTPSEQRLPMFLNLRGLTAAPSSQFPQLQKPCLFGMLLHETQLPPAPLSRNLTHPQPTMRA